MHKPVDLEETTLVEFIFNKINVMIPITGAAIAKIAKCLLTLALSRPSCIKKETKPNAAGALFKKNVTFQI